MGGPGPAMTCFKVVDSCLMLAEMGDCSAGCEPGGRASHPPSFNVKDGSCKWGRRGGGCERRRVLGKEVVKLEGEWEDLEDGGGWRCRSSDFDTSRLCPCAEMPKGKGPKPSTVVRVGLLW